MVRLLSIVVLLIFSNTLYALEAEIKDVKFKFYGQLSFALSYTNTNNAFLNEKVNNGTDIFVTTRDSLDLLFFNSSHLGANVEFGKFAGKMEIQTKYQPSYGINNLPDSVFRRFFISYDFEKAGKITIGKDWTTAGYFFNQYANYWQGMCGYGLICPIRAPQVKYNVAGFEATVVYAGQDGHKNMVINNSTKSASNQYLPRFEAAYAYQDDNIFFKIYGAYSKYFATAEFLDNNATVTRNLETDTYVFGLLPIFYIKDFSIALSAFVAQNAYLYGAFTNSRLMMPVYNYQKNTMQPIISLGAAVVMTYKFSDTVNAMFGGGYTTSSDNYFKNMRQDDRLSIYLNVPIKIATYLNLVPEISYFDELKNYDRKYEGSAVFYTLYLDFIF